MCGQAPSEIKEVGLTPEHQLVIRWPCAACKIEMFVVKDLADCWLECPKEPAPPAAPPVDNEWVRKADEAFLHSIGIRLGE